MHFRPHSVMLVGQSLHMLLLALPVTVATCERSFSKPRASLHMGPAGAWAEAVIWATARAPEYLCMTYLFNLLCIHKKTTFCFFEMIRKSWVQLSWMGEYNTVT